MPYKAARRRILLAEKAFSHGERQMLRGFQAIAGERNWLVLNVQTAEAVKSAIGNWDPHVCVVGPRVASQVPRRVWGDRVIVGINVNSRRIRVASVHPDDFAIGVEAADHLLAKGFRSFASFQIGSYPWSKARAAGFKQTVEAAGATYITDGILEGAALDSPNFASDWARTMPAGTAVLACCDEWAAVLVLACQINSIAVPEELAVMGVDDDDLCCEMCQPHLSSVRIPWQEIGRTVAKQVDRFFRTGRPPREVVSLPPAGVVERRSTELLAAGHPAVVRALSYMRDRAHESITVGEVVDYVTANRRWLERAFRHHLGRSILQEMHRAKMDRARRLLATSTLAIPGVARGCGFGEAAARFTRSFHRDVGMTPTAYRRKFTMHR